MGYPLALSGELKAQFLEHVGSGTINHAFERHANDQGFGSLNGASGGLIVAIRNHQYRPVALMLEESEAVLEAAVDSKERAENPSRFYALPLLELRNMVEKAGRLPFRNRDGKIVFEIVRE